MNTLFSEIFRMSLTGSGIICMVLLARLILRKAPKIYSYLLWSVVLIRLLCPVGIPVRGLPSLPEIKIKEVQSQETVRISAPEKGMPETEAHREPEFFGEREPYSGPDLQTLISRIWAAGAVSIAFYGMGSYIRFRRHLVGAVRLRQNIYAADHIGGAYVVGLVKPRIYVDSGIPDDQLPYILVHEQTHIRRLDHVTRCLAFMALCLHWFNPLVWAAFLLSGRDMEMSCDEAVISRMGARVRMPYSQSLLTLASGQHIRLGCPVAFGEGSTRGRVQNLARWKKTGKKLQLLCILASAAVVLLCACEPSDRMPQEAEQREAFLSLDGSTCFTWNLGEMPELSDMPILALQPHEITEKDVQSIFGRFYGASPVYDLGTTGQRIYSKEELQRRLEFLRTYEDPESRKNLQLSQDDGADPNLIPVEIQKYEKQLSSAPKEVPYSQWDGSFETQPWLNSRHDVLRVFGWRKDLPYTAAVQLDSYQGESWNGIAFALSDGQRYDITDYLAAAVMHTAPKPSEEQAAQWASEAQTALDDLGLGKWQPVEADIWGNSSETQYGVNVQTVQVLEGIPMLLQQESSFFRRSQPEDRIPLPIPSAYLSYTPGGTMTELFAHDFMEVREILDPHAGILSPEELMTCAEQQLSSYRAPVLASYAWTRDCALEELSMEAAITEVQVGLGLQKLDGEYLAVPAVEFLGRLKCSRGDTGIGDTGPDPIPLITLNATDGSVIG